MDSTIQLTHVEDDRIAAYRDLRWDRKPLSETKHFIAEGRLCVQRLLESDLTVESLLVERGKEPEAEAWSSPETPIYSLPPDKLRSLVGFDFHRGLMACGIRPQLRDVGAADLHTSASRLGIAALQVAERENLGSMMRSAAGFGADTILLGPGTADPFSRRAIRVSMGTVFRLRLFRFEQPIEQLPQFHASGIRTIAASIAESATPLSGFQRDDNPCLLLMGNEACGLPQELRELASDELSIPMEMGIDSLNVAVAAAVFLYALRASSYTSHDG